MTALVHVSRSFSFFVHFLQDIPAEYLNVDSKSVEELIDTKRLKKGERLSKSLSSLENCMSKTFCLYFTIVGSRVVSKVHHLGCNFLSQMID